MPRDRHSPSCAGCADLLVRRLTDHGVRHVFGYPGGQLTPIYDALARQNSIRHVLARHEQASAFMADGYARATGKPGVCLAVCGPGVFNAFTPLHTSFTDSIPVLLISGQVPARGRGPRTGYYHENDQLSAAASLTKLQIRVEDPGDIVPALDRALEALRTGRPGPVLFEVPVDILRSQVPDSPWPGPSDDGGTRVDPAAIRALVRWLQGRQRPLILAGGGVVSAGAEQVLAGVAERLGAPVLHTANGKCALPASHPLAAGMSWSRGTSDLSNMGDYFSPLFQQADGLLAVGCRFTQLTTGSWLLKPPPVAHIDIDPQEIGRHYPADVSLVADARTALTALLDELPRACRTPWAKEERSCEPWRLPGIDLMGPLRRAAPPDTIFSVDVTRAAYVMMVEFPLDHPRTFLHPAGSVAMGYALPAGLGAKTAYPDRPVVVVVGDGGLQMSALELASSVQEGLPVVVVVVNDRCLTLIKATQERRYDRRFIAVDVDGPDWGKLAEAFGVGYRLARSEGEVEESVRAGLRDQTTVLVEVRPGDARE